MNHIGEKMHYMDRESGVKRQIVLEEQWDDVEHVCKGCVLEDVQYCLRKIVPEQSHYVCAPRNTGVLYVFKYKEEG